jgi:MFS family permease
MTRPSSGFRGARSLGAFVSILGGRTGGLIATLCVSGLTTGMLQLSLPLHLEQLRAGPAAIGAVLSMFGVGTILFEFFWGWLADRVGVVPPILVSQLAYSLVVAAFLLTSSVPAFAVLYLLAAGMMVSGAPIARAFIAVSMPAERRGMALGLVTAQFTLGSGAGSLIAGFLMAHAGFTAVMQVATIFPLAGAAIALLTFRGDYRVRIAQLAAGGAGPGSAVGGATPATGPPRSFVRPLVAISVVIMIMLVGFSGERTTLPILVTGGLGMSPAYAGAVVSALGILTAVMMVPGGRVSDVVGRRLMIVVGLVVSVLGLLTYGFASTLQLVFGAVVLRAVGVSLTWPAATALLAESSPATRQGLVMGVFGEFENVGMTFGPLAAGYAWSAVGIRASFVVLAVIGAIGAVAAVVLINERRWARA